MKEPLLHFAILGALLFALYGWIHSGSDDGRHLVVTSARVSLLSSRFERTWQRPPTPQELSGLVDAWVREEILVREGLAQGLDRDDPVVRQRILQKMAFAAEAASERPPTEDELKDWLTRHPERYAIEARYSLEQVYFDPQRRGTHLAQGIAQAKAALGALESEPNSELSDPSMLPARPTDRTSAELARIYGDEFAKAIEPLPRGSWQGPIRSAYGLHLVRIDGYRDGRPATLEEARAQLNRDVREALRQKAEAQFYETLRAAYVVELDAAALPSPGASGENRGTAGTGR